MYCDIFYCTLQDKNRTKLDCPICEARELRKLSNHLKIVHKIDGTERKSLIKKARKSK